jgi:hypothetical protein
MKHQDKSDNLAVDEASKDKSSASDKHQKMSDTGQMMLQKFSYRTDRCRYSKGSGQEAKTYLTASQG